MASDSVIGGSVVEYPKQFLAGHPVGEQSTLSDKIGKSLLKLFRRLYVGWNGYPSTSFELMGPIDPEMMPIDLSDIKKYGRV